MRSVLLAVLLLGATVACAAAPDARQALDACIARLDSSLDVDYARIAERCPELTAALTHSSAAAWLPADWNRADNELSASGLAELRTLLGRADQSRPARASAPSTQRVAAVLAALAIQEPPAQGSWWNRFKAWLRRIMSQQPAPDQSWLARWLRAVTLSQSSMDLITWTCLTVLVVLAGAVIANELRLAGVFGRRKLPTGSVAKAAGADAELTLRQIDCAEWRAQPAMLLELIAARLTQRGLLPPARTLTARELSRRAQLPDESGRARLGELVTVCERIRFADEDVEEGQRRGALRGGRELLAAIATLPSPAAGPWTR